MIQLSQLNFAAGQVGCSAQNQRAGRAEGASTDTNRTACFQRARSNVYATHVHARLHAKGGAEEQNLTFTSTGF